MELARSFVRFFDSWNYRYTVVGFSKPSTHVPMESQEDRHGALIHGDGEAIHFRDETSYSLLNSFTRRKN